MLAEAVTRSIYEFLVVFIHAASYVAEVYPKESYKLVRQYDTATYENCHPGVKLWAENAAKSVMQMVYATPRSSRALISLAVLENQRPIERFGLELAQFETTQTQGPDVAATEVSEQFKACISKLYATCIPASAEGTSEASVLSAPPRAQRSMTLLYEGNVNLPEIPNVWIAAEAKPRTEKFLRTTPIRSIEVGTTNSSVFVMNIFRQPAP